MAFNYSYSVLSTDFDLEPILAEYLATYPKGSVAHYQVVFQAENEPEEGTKSYIVVFILKARQEYTLSFTEYLEAYCKVNDKVAIASALENTFPYKKMVKVRHNPYRVYGNLK